jgi:hypothetical protein
MYKHIIKLSNFYLLITLFTWSNIIGTNAIAQTASVQTSIFETQLEGSSCVISRNDQAKTYNIEISATGKIEVLDIFDLNNPSRLVIDLKHISIGKNAVFSIENDSLFKQVRIGRHADKTRLVFDLSGQSFPEYTWEPINNSTINVFLKTSGGTENLALSQQSQSDQKEITNTSVDIPKAVVETQIQNPVQPLPEAVEQAAIMDKKSIFKPVESQIIENTKSGNLNTQEPELNKDLNQNIEPNQELTNLDDQQDLLEKQDDDSPQGLENIKFYYQKEKNTPLVRFILIKKPEYRLKKESDKRYILTIPEAGIRWPHLELPQFPPRDFRGFTMVMPEKNGSDLNIAIGIERGSSISSFTKDNEIWLKIN